MRAAVLRTPGQPVRIEDVELDAPGPGELEVSVEAAGVCHSDLHYLRGDLVCPLPVVPGHEGAGRVLRVGAGVPESRVGERVAFLWRPSCGTCPPCRDGQPVMCELGPVQARQGGLGAGPGRLHQGSERVHHLMGVSCFAERVVVSASATVPIPDEVPPEVAAIVGCAVVTGFGAVSNVVGACAGRPLVVIGAGGVGLSAVMAARLAGASPVIVMDLDDGRLELAKKVGATHTVNPGDGDGVEAVLAIVPGGADWVIEAVGRPATLRAGVGMLAPGGAVVAVGLARVDETVALPINELVQRQKRVIGSLYGSSNPFLDIPRILRLYLDGRLPLDELVGTSYPLDEVTRAFDELQSGALGRGILVPGAAS